jgi:hypothetical protein
MKQGINDLLFRRIKEKKKKKSGGGKKKAHMPQKNWRFGLVASGLRDS